LIREDLNYKNKPIVPVLNPQGRVVNYNAMHMIFVWGIDAFPFRPTDDESLTQKWNWFWAEMKKAYPRLQDLVSTNFEFFLFMQILTNNSHSLSIFDITVICQNYVELL
jgi:hypothetical protein